MRTTVLIDDELLKEAKDYSGLEKTSQVIEAALNDFVANLARQRLLKLEGSYKDSELSVPPRRRQE